MKALIDTCVIIDVLQRRNPFFDDAYKIFMLCANGKFEGYLSAKSITDIYYLTHRSTHSNDVTKEALRKLFVLFNLLDTASTDVKLALDSNVSDYEDAVMIETAKRSGMDCIVTRNIKDHSTSSVPVFTLEQFVKRVKKRPLF